MPDILINVTQLAEKLGLSRGTIYDRISKCREEGWADEDLLPRPVNKQSWQRLGNRPRWSQWAVDAWLAKRPMRRVV